MSDVFIRLKNDETIFVKDAKTDIYKISACLNINCEYLKIKEYIIKVSEILYIKAYEAEQ